VELELKLEWPGGARSCQGLPRPFTGHFNIVYSLGEN
jgi:hypothetical protein